MAEIILKDISFQYLASPHIALKNINLTIKQGELCAIIGANGSGKTTLCNIIRGFIPSFHQGELKGEVFVQGNALNTENLGSLSEHIGFVFQNPFAQISQSKDTVFEELAFGLENLGVPKWEMIRRVEEIMNLLQINHLKDANPMELSGGQKQKIAFASIMIMNPDIYVIDEPTSQLDPVQTEMIFELIAMLKKQGKTIILVEHKIELVAQYADQVVVLENGEIKLQGSTKEVFNYPKLSDFGVRAPIYTDMARLMNIKGNDLPITYDEIIQALNNGSKGKNNESN